MNYLVFGASGTLGQAVISQIVANGDEFVGVVRADKYDGLIEGNYVYNCDVSDADAVERSLTNIKNTCGVPDHVISCVGKSERHDFVADSLESWKDIFNVNYMGAVNMIHYASKCMIEAGKSGSIILIGSGYGERCVPFLSSYCAGKGALAALVKVLSTELAQKNIRINLVTPGLFPSRMTKGFVQNENYIKQLLKHIPDGMLGNVDDLAKLIVFLTSKACRHINGAKIVVD